MFRTIVVACDQPEQDRDAVALARTLAHAEHADLSLVAACHEPLTAPVEPGRHSGLHGQRETKVGRLRDELAPEARVVLVPAGSAAQAVARAAEREDADLIVVGISRRRGNGRASGPDRALQVLRGAPCAVAVVPGDGTAPGRLESLAVGFDGSRESWSALALAVDVARAVHAELRICLVVDDHVPGSAAPWAAASYGVNWYGVLADRHRHAGELLDHAVARASGLSVRADVLVGEPARELAAVDADLVVVGSRRQGPLRRIAFGSTSEALIRHAHTPVLVAPGGVVDEQSVASARADTPAPTP